MEVDYVFSILKVTEFFLESYLILVLVTVSIILSEGSNNSKYRK
jgi:hypothetical protein